MRRPKSLPSGFTAGNLRWPQDDSIRWNGGSIVLLVFAVATVEHAFIGWLPTWTLGAIAVVLAAYWLLRVMRRIWPIALVAFFIIAAYTAWVRVAVPDAVAQSVREARVWLHLRSH